MTYALQILGTAEHTQHVRSQLCAVTEKDTNEIRQILAVAAPQANSWIQ